MQKVPFGVDPKTVLCQFYKQGHCEKGKKCKFSHNLDVERRGEKKSLYTDTREEEEGEGDEKKKDDMVDWDEEKLRQVVLSKHGNVKTTTDKVWLFMSDDCERSMTDDALGLQILHRGSRKRQIRLVLDMSQRRRPMQIPTLPPSRLRAQDARTANGRKGRHGELTLTHAHIGRLPRV